MISKSARLFLSVLVVLGLSGCASYTTPGGAADLTGIQSADIRELMLKQPAAKFPALTTLARVQAPGYTTMTSDTYGDGAFVVVTNRELMGDDAMAKLSAAKGVKELTPLNRLLLPTTFNHIEDLRTASARVKADILLIYTLDTSFRVDGKTIGPLTVLSLGLMRDRETVVSTTASAMLVDVRTGFVFGTAEATATENQVANAWSSANNADQGRLRTERASFDKLIDELVLLWADVLSKHG